MINSESDSLLQPQDIFAFGVTAAFICNAQGIFQCIAKSQEKRWEAVRWGWQYDWQICSFAAQQPMIRRNCSYKYLASDPATRTL